MKNVHRWWNRGNRRFRASPSRKWLRQAPDLLQRVEPVFSTPAEASVAEQLRACGVWFSKRSHCFVLVGRCPMCEYARGELAHGEEWRPLPSGTAFVELDGSLHCGRHGWPPCLTYAGALPLDVWTYLLVAGAVDHEMPDVRHQAQALLDRALCSWSAP